MHLYGSSCRRSRRAAASLALATLTTALSGALAGGALPASAAPAAAAAPAASVAPAPARATCSPSRPAGVLAAEKLLGGSARGTTPHHRIAAGTRAAAATVVGSALQQGSALGPGDSLRSPSGRYSLVMGTDGVLSYQEAPNRLNSQPVSQNVLPDDPANPPVPGSFLAMQTDGNLVLYGPDQKVRYNFDTVGQGRFLQVQDDGNVVLYGANNSVVINFGYADRSYLLPGEALLPGDHLRSVDGATVMYMQGDGNLVIYTAGRAVFQTGTSGQDGAAAILQGDGNFVVYSAADPAQALYNTGTSNSSGAGTELDLFTASFTVLVPSRTNAVALYGTAWGTDTVLPGQVLFPGDRRRSAGGACTVLLQTDGNLVDYCAGKVVFATGTSGDDIALMSENGDFAVLSLSGDTLTVTFHTGTGRYPGSRLVVQGDRNLVVYTPQGRAVFSIHR